VREIAYDEVHHAQQHFRSLLNSVAYPGTIRDLQPVEVTPPPGLSRSSVLLAFALLNADVSFHLVDFEPDSADYLTANTRASAAPIAEAAFVFARGDSDPELLEGIHCGSLPYPDTAATLVLQVAQLSPSPLPGGLKLELEGPGVKGMATVFVRGLNADLLLAVQARNAEFPLGIDTFLTSDAGGRPSALAIPRSVQAAWEQL